MTSEAAAQLVAAYIEAADPDGNPRSWPATPAAKAILKLPRAERGAVLRQVMKQIMAMTKPTVKTWVWWNMVANTEPGPRLIALLKAIVKHKEPPPQPDLAAVIIDTARIRSTVIAIKEPTRELVDAADRAIAAEGMSPELRKAIEKLRVSFEDVFNAEEKRMHDRLWTTLSQ